jgi:cytoskeletal protein CcmA (bactofilin family)
MKHINPIIYILLLLVATGCGGSGSSGGAIDTSPNDPPLISGIGRTGISTGPISTFGSVVVNGVRYDTSTAAFSINGNPGTQDDLSVGDVVTVKGTIDDNGVDGTADEVNFDDNVKGPIQSIDPAINRLVVLGQIVQINSETSFDDSISPASIDGLQVDDVIEVSGLVNADGVITATRIELKTGTTEFEVLGVVSGLNTSTTQFNINDLVVDYGSAVLEGFGADSISDGDLVEAKGTAFGSGGELIATRVERENAFPETADGDFVEIQGFITRFASATDFDVSGFPVTTTAGTVYEGGDASDLALNVKVEIEGDINSAGVLVATEVDIRRAKAVRVTANVDSVDTASNTLVVLGITVSIDELTRLEDKSDADVRPLTLASINAGDYIEVRGSELPADSGDILATILEREDLDTEAVLRGFVESVTEPTITILGVTIQTGPGTVFRDAADNVLSATEFFAQISAGSLIEAKGTESADTVITAEEVEIEVEF